MIENILTGLGLSGSAGLNAYLPLLMMGVAERTNIVQLGEPFDALSSWPALLLITLLLLVEMTADKIPLVDSMNDVLNSFMRPAVGALLMAASTALDGQDATTIGVIGGILMGSVSAGAVHGVKMTVRPGVTASTGGLGTIFVSLAEDALSFLVSAFAIFIPFIVMFFVGSLGVVGFWWRWDRGRMRRYFPKTPSAGGPPLSPLPPRDKPTQV